MKKARNNRNTGTERPTLENREGRAPASATATPCENSTTKAQPPANLGHPPRIKFLDIKKENTRPFQKQEGAGTRKSNISHPAATC